MECILLTRVAGKVAVIVVEDRGTAKKYKRCGAINAPEHKK
ncbi:MAG: hypothetical protein AAB519_03885 [Patescibacteria group bacterium]